MTQITGPHGVSRLTPPQGHAHGDLALLHYPLTVFFTVLRVPAALDCHMNVVQLQVNAALVQVFNAGITNSRQNAPQVGVAGEEGCFDQR